MHMEPIGPHCRSGLVKPHTLALIFYGRVCDRDTHRRALRSSTRQCIPIGTRSAWWRAVYAAGHSGALRCALFFSHAESESFLSLCEGALTQRPGLGGGLQGRTIARHPQFVGTVTPQGEHLCPHRTCPAAFFSIKLDLEATCLSVYVRASGCVWACGWPWK